MRFVLAITALIAACATAPRPVPTRRLGDAMDEADLRFQRSERAAIAGRWELAKADLHELEQIFATSPWRGKPQLLGLAHRFQTQQLVALRTAVETHDHAAFERAATETARACNACHRAADEGQIEISESLGTTDSALLAGDW